MDGEPNPPGSPEARAVLERFIATRCQFRYAGHGYAAGERCSERAVWPKAHPAFCCREHSVKRKGSRYRARIAEIPVYGGSG